MGRIEEGERGLDGGRDRHDGRNGHDGHGRRSPTHHRRRSPERDKRTRRHSLEHARDRHNSNRRSASNPTSHNYRPSRDNRLHKRAGDRTFPEPNRLSAHGYRAPTPPRQYRDQTPGRSPPKLKIGNLPSLDIPWDQLPPELDRFNIPERVEKLIKNCSACHPYFQYSRCTGRKKAVCVCAYQTHLL